MDQGQGQGQGMEVATVAVSKKDFSMLFKIIG